MAGYEEDFYTVDTVEVQEITIDDFNQEVVNTISVEKMNPDPIGQAGRVIQVARDLVALGEEVYTLVNKGRPNVTTDYAPISVVPKIGGKAVDVMDTENWRLPRHKAYKIIYKNLLNISVIEFKFKVVWAFGGQYEGKGAYISSAQIIPAAHVLWGFDFSAKMRLGGIQNAGTRKNPVAVATLLLEYTAHNMLNSSTNVETFVITGSGGFRKL